MYSQAIVYLKTGVWHSLSTMDFLLCVVPNELVVQMGSSYLELGSCAGSLQQWLLLPTSWFGLHKQIADILNAAPVTLSAVAGAGLIYVAGILICALPNVVIYRDRRVTG
jgi:hypothetical protein